MYNTIIELFSGILNVYGTIIMVLTVINIDFKNLYIDGTIEKLSHPEINAFTNRKNALNGIVIIVVGFVVEIIEKCYTFDMISMIVTCLMICIILYLMRIYYYMQYIFLLQEYDKYLIRKGEESLFKHIKNGENIRTKKVPIRFNVDKYIKRLD